MRAEQVARQQPEKSLGRFEAVGGFGEKPDMRDAPAMLGGAKKPQLTLNKVLDAYWGLANLIFVIGDRPVAGITGDELLDFRIWWIERIDENDVTPGSANKDLAHLGDVLNTVNRMKRLGLPMSDPVFRVRVPTKKMTKPANAMANQ